MPSCNRQNAHHSTPSSSRSSEERLSEDCRCTSAGNQIHSRNARAQIKTVVRRKRAIIMQVAKQLTNLIKWFVRADDHLWLVRMDSYEFLTLGDSGVLHSSKKGPFKPLLQDLGFIKGPVCSQTCLTLPGHQDHQVVVDINIIASNINIVSWVHGILWAEIK